MELSEEVVLLCDSSKVNKKDYFRMCGQEQIDYLITDKPLPKKMGELLQSKEVEVLY